MDFADRKGLEFDVDERGVIPPVLREEPLAVDEGPATARAVVSILSLLVVGGGMFLGLTKARCSH